MRCAQVSSWQQCESEAALAAQSKMPPQGGYKATPTMALSETVVASLKEAESNLRNALAYSARMERPIVCNQISKLIADIDHIQSFDGIMDRVDSLLK